jgi:hypothetical protein
MSDVSGPDDGIKVRVQHNHTCSHGRGDSSSRSNRSKPSKRWETHYFVECDSAHDAVELSDLEDKEDEKECVSWQRIVLMNAGSILPGMQDLARVTRRCSYILRSTTLYRANFPFRVTYIQCE